MAINIRPLHDRIVVEPVEAEEISKGGIIIPGTAREKPVQAKVLAVGNGAILESGNVRPLDVKVGDIILHDKYAGTEFKMNGETYLMLREIDVHGVIVEAQP